MRARRSAVVCRATMLVIAIVFAVAGCAEPNGSPDAEASLDVPPPEATATATPPPTPEPTDPAGPADSLVAAEQALRDPSSSEAALTDAARRQ